jgi:hypothetical protein
MTFDDSKTIHIIHSSYGLVYSAVDCKDEEEAWQSYLDDNEKDIAGGLYESPGDTTFDRTYHRWTDNPRADYEDCHEFVRTRPIHMADPTPSTPLDAPGRRTSPANQMAALTGESVKRSPSDPEEAGENTPVREIGNVSKVTPFQDLTDHKPSRGRRSPPIQPSTRSDTAAAPVSPPAPTDSATLPRPNPTAPQPAPPASRSAAGPSSPAAQDRPNEASRSSQGAAPLTGAAMVAAALTGNLRRADPPAAASRRPLNPSSIGSP